MLQSAMRTLSHQLPPLEEGFVRLYLCRHGETDFNQQGIMQGRGVNAQLNKTGQRQAMKLARAFDDVPLKAIYSSCLQRARETAGFIQQSFPSVKTGAFTDLEEMSFGSMEGTSTKSNDAAIKEIYAKWKQGKLDTKFPNGECPLDVEKRGVTAIHDLVSMAEDDDHIAFVCHGRFNKIILSSLLNVPLDNPALKQDNTCINVLDFNRRTGTYTAVALNNTKHLSA
ncbi:hypothetical protein LEN26_011394 [Aphanomyces euteiches]|uniref:Phosphoglycerate mutase n=1 Tax=Aphanomyces euteiches TaxID=100861 RepID=A0A6G0XA30_9STRA|nr:hypothetical protein Ae201684_006775 [Aphanomyces euteiches]KAH9087181.1 hypothetical protein Ae201684P_000593 [Aphanomyces euteiches]KAH9109531.1 hypothetical protein AeMF1_015411 [Aphanomyces euteiches]KAH9119865.1 hypothetical protein LEN26_011394 [Aphanomyces euteiches]KAH9144118.1 hypothetical protein AeRB84_011916 [Aphanomyces euteiches]